MSAGNYTSLWQMGKSSWRRWKWRGKKTNKRQLIKENLKKKKHKRKDCCQNVKPAHRQWSEQFVGYSLCKYKELKSHLALSACDSVFPSNPVNNQSFRKPLSDLTFTGQGCSLFSTAATCTPSLINKHRNKNRKEKEMSTRCFK